MSIQLLKLPGLIILVVLRVCKKSFSKFPNPIVFYLLQVTLALRVFWAISYFTKYKIVRHSNLNIGRLQVKCGLLTLTFLMQWISSIYWKCYKLNSSISEKCWKFIASKMLEIKSRHLTWGSYWDFALRFYLSTILHQK